MKDTQEGERVEEGSMRVDLSIESRSAEDPAPLPSENGEAYQQRLLPLRVHIEPIEL